MHPLIIAALIGGTTGGLSAGARGTDPWKGILSGAVTGAATSGLGSLIGPAATSGAATATTKTAEEIAKQKIIDAQIKSAMTKANAPAMLSNLSTGAKAQSINQLGGQELAALAGRDNMSSAAVQQALNPPPEVPYQNFKKAMDPFDLHKGEYIGRAGYATTPSAAWAGELAFNPPEKKKKKGPPLNMLYGRNPDRFMFGEWSDPDKIKEIYEDKDNPYYYPEYAEGGPVSPMVGAAGTAQAVAEYLQENGVEPTMENVQDVIEKIISQQQQPYEPMTGLGGQLQRMTQQYARPLGEEVIEESETVQGMKKGGVMTPQTGSQKGDWQNWFLNMGNRGPFGGNTATPNPSSERGDWQDWFLDIENRKSMNQGGTPRRYYQEGGLGAMMGDMMPTGDLDMRPGGEPIGPGTGTSDDIPAMLSDGEFVMTAEAVEGAGGGDRELGSNRMMNMMRNFEQGGEPSQESQGLGSMEETTMTEMIGPQGMMMEDTMMEGIA